MTLWVAALLGVIQGLFMFLPVSSTAHMTLTQHGLNALGAGDLPPEHPEMILFYLVAHVGTLVSIAVVFWPSLSRFSLKLLSSATQPAAQRDNLWWKLFFLGMVSVLVTGVIGLSLKPIFETVFAHPATIAVTLYTTGVLLWLSDRLAPRLGRLRDISWGTAGFIGFAQALALAPGFSRSAMTMVAGLFAGMKRRWVAEYSFFLAIPTIILACLVHGYQVYRHGQWLEHVGLGALFIGFVVSALVGIIALKLVIKLLYRAQLKIFAFYVWTLATVLLAFNFY